MLNYFNVSKSTKGFLLMWKIDLEKTYYKLDWDFMGAIHQEVGILAKWRNLIMECVKVEKMQLIWNGELTRSYSSSRGIRQG